MFQPEKNKTIFRVLFGGILLLLIGICAYYVKNPPAARLRINNHIFTIDVAATSAEKERGLGYRKAMPADYGMLFPFPRSDRHQFWMKGMEFALDFVWINGTTVVDITRDVPPPTVTGTYPVYQPSVPADKVLELNAGTVARTGIEIGDTITILR
jgi:uncharacterized membrane protein (UPF0127 family)